MIALIGAIIGNRYEILELIGGGGMAEVYKALDLILQREVAVKILHRQFVHDEDFVKRFRREAHAVASLSHENVIDIYDVGEEKDVYYIVMEYIEGSTLKELIQRKGRLPVEEALAIAEKIGSALQHAHFNQIIHRDIKPQNILIGKSGEVKVTDFGIARATTSATITYTDSVLGSVHYLSPEQARGGWTDEKTDLYSLGVVLYEMITGSLPFSGDSPISIALKHVQDRFIYPKEINPDIPQSVENIILKALVKDPSQRYSSADDMLEDIKTALLPEKINEPQVQLDHGQMPDVDKTMMMPPIKVINNKAYSPHSRSVANKKNVVGKITFISIISLLLATGIFGFQIISNKWIVPEVKVPILTEKLKSQAIQELDTLHLSYKIIERFDDDVKEGLVTKQEPLEGTFIKENQVVTLFISLGKERTSMPNLLNMQKSQAEFLLKQQGFTTIEIVDAYEENTPIGHVFRQEPLAEQMVIADEVRVLLFVSKGKERFEMPNLISKTEQEAEAILTKINLQLGEVKEEYTFEQSKGRIYKQFPFEPGREVTAGDQVDIYVSKGYPTEAKTIYSDILIPLNEDEQAEITIIIKDSRGKEIQWKKEIINGSKFYDNIELVLMPEDQGLVSVYKNGKQIKTKQVSYY